MKAKTNQQGLKISRYLESEHFVDQNDQKQKTLLFSTRSLKLLCLDTSLYNCIQMGELDLFNVALIEKLKDAKILVPMFENELESVLSENKASAQNQDEIYLVFQTSAACQLGCAYCGQVHKKLEYSDQTIAAIPDFVRRKFLHTDHKYKSIYVCWFGAEPLTGLASLRKLSTSLQALAAEHDLKFASKMVTNGLLLREAIAEELIVDHKVNFFEITLDGDAKAHNERRHTKAGQPTFERIFKNIAAVASLPHSFQISIRANVDARNFKNISPLLQRLREHDLHEKIQFYIAPLHSWGNDAHTLAAEQEMFSQWELDVFLEMQSLGFDVNLLPRRNKVTCLAVNESGLLIDPSGDLYNCTEVSLVPTYENNGGNIHNLRSVSAGVIDEERKQIFANFFDDLSEKKYPCSACPILPVCGGRCPKEWNEGRVPCPPMKFNMKERMILSYVRNMSRDEHVARCD